MQHTPIETIDGFQTFQFEHWKGFYSLIEEIASFEAQQAIPSYIWRGQQDAAWSLSTTLDRLFSRFGLSQANNSTLEAAALRHLEGF